MPHAQRHRGKPSAYLPPTAFISFIQNHDQVGNRPFGERLTELADPAAIRALVAIYLLSPQIPMLFMGEEWAIKRPFLFFSDVGGELADAIRSSRQKDFGEAGTSSRGRPPDPMLEDTFLACKLDWEQIETGVHSHYLSLYRQLLAIRREQITPRLEGMTDHKGRYELIGHQAFRVWWTLGDGAELSLLANLSAEPLQNVDIWASDHPWLEGYASGSVLEAWSVVFRLV